MNELRQKIRFQALVPFVTKLRNKREAERGLTVWQDESKYYEEVENQILQIIKDTIDANMTEDHTQCPMPLTCVGYVSAHEDVEYALGLKELDDDEIAEDLREAH